MALTARNKQTGGFAKYGGVRPDVRQIYGRMEEGFFGVIVTEAGESLFGPFDTRREASNAALAEIRGVAKWCRGYSLCSE